MKVMLVTLIAVITPYFVYTGESKTQIDTSLKRQPCSSELEGALTLLPRPMVPLPLQEFRDSSASRSEPILRIHPDPTERKEGKEEKVLTDSERVLRYERVLRFVLQNQKQLKDQVSTLQQEVRALQHQVGQDKASTPSSRTCWEWLCCCTVQV